MKFGLPAPSTVFTFSGTSVTVKRIILEFHHKGRLLFRMSWRRKSSRHGKGSFIAWRQKVRASPQGLLQELGHILQKLTANFECFSLGRTFPE